MGCSKTQENEPWTQILTILRKDLKIKSYNVREDFFWVRFWEKKFFFFFFFYVAKVFYENIFWKHFFYVEKNFGKHFIFENIYILFKKKGFPFLKNRFFFFILKTLLENRFFLLWKQFWKTGFYFETIFENSFILKKTVSENSFALKTVL